MTKVATKKPTQSPGGVKADDKLQPGSIKAFYNPKTKTAVASTDSLDRMGEIIDQGGWDLKNFQANPVLLWAHDDKTPRIGLAQNIRIEKSGGQPALMFEPKFNDATELSRAIKQIFEEDGGTFSVGFMPLEMDGNTYTKSELLEISAVNVPANPDARTLSYKNLRMHGISKDIAAEVVGAKGAIQDELDEEAMWEAKYGKMDACFDVFYAFCDVFFDPNTPIEQFEALITECISLFQQIADGSYQDPDDSVVTTDDDEDAALKILRQVLDNKKKGVKNERNKAKTPSAAPKRKSVHEERLQMAKVLAKAADILMAGEKKNLPAEQRKSVTKVIKRASEIMIEQHKTELKNNG